ncbi:MAG: SUMF1/EgtB/PvdO family nonheme iron enzyme [Treponemataceae bacterium]
MKKVLLIPIILLSIAAYAQDEKKAGMRKSVGGIDFVYCPAGSFMMGTAIPPADYENESPRHKVALEAFWISKYEITQSRYESVKEENPSSFPGNAENPVEKVSWYDAVEFCNELSVKSGISPYYSINKSETDPNNHNKFDKVKWIVNENAGAGGFRLPTEAEWEYACRAGTETIYYWGNQKDASTISTYEVCEINSWKKGENHPDYGTHAVGTKKPNAWGIFDMSGNVSEWCWDWFDEKFYAASPRKNPKGPIAGEDKVVRGASWFFGAAEMRSALRARTYPISRFDKIGIRVVLSNVN